MAQGFQQLVQFRSRGMNRVPRAQIGPLFQQLAEVARR